jgi:hypothetical protein
VIHIDKQEFSSMVPDNLRAGFSHRTGEAAQEEVAKLRLQKSTTLFRNALVRRDRSSKDGPTKPQPALRMFLK